MKKLNYKEFGEGQPLIILHGLFGMLDNWNSFAQELKDEFHIFLVDQRNHGRSFHDDEMNYELMAEDLSEFMEEHDIEEAYIMGHSMGGKTAMSFAGQFPEKVKKLIVVDIAPKEYQPGHEEIFKALRSLPVEEIDQRQDAREHLNQYIEDEGVRLFLLKNLKRNKNGNYEWRMNLKGIYQNYENILSALPESIHFDGPALFISGERSDYIQNGDKELIRDHFPSAKIEVISDAGHWVHADRQDKLLEVVRSFLDGQ